MFRETCLPQLIVEVYEVSHQPGLLTSLQKRGAYLELLCIVSEFIEEG